MVQLIHKRSEERETLQKAELPENDKRCIIKENTSPGNVKSNMVFICSFNIKKKTLGANGRREPGASRRRVTLKEAYSCAKIDLKSKV